MPQLTLPVNVSKTNFQALLTSIPNVDPPAESSKRGKKKKKSKGTPVVTRVDVITVTNSAVKLRWVADGDTESIRTFQVQVLKDGTSLPVILVPPSQLSFVVQSLDCCSAVYNFRISAVLDDGSVTAATQAPAATQLVDTSLKFDVVVYDPSTVAMVSQVAPGVGAARGGLPVRVSVVNVKVGSSFSVKFNGINCQPPKLSWVRAGEVLLDVVTPRISCLSDCTVPAAVLVTSSGISEDLPFDFFFTGLQPRVVDIQPREGFLGVESIFTFMLAGFSLSDAESTVVRVGSDDAPASIMSIEPHGAMVAVTIRFTATSIGSTEFKILPGGRSDERAVVISETGQTVPVEINFKDSTTMRIWSITPDSAIPASGGVEIQVYILNLPKVKKSSTLDVFYNGISVKTKLKSSEEGGFTCLSFDASPVSSTAKSASLKVSLKKDKTQFDERYIRVEPARPPEISSITPPMAITTGSTLKIGTRHFSSKLLKSSNVRVTVQNSELTKVKVKGSEIECATPPNAEPGIFTLSLFVANGDSVVRLNQTLEIRAPVLPDPIVSPNYGGAGTELKVSQTKDWYPNGFTNDAIISFQVAESTIVASVKSIKAKNHMQSVSVVVPVLPIDMRSAVNCILFSSGQVLDSHL